MISDQNCSRTLPLLDRRQECFTSCYRRSRQTYPRFFFQRRGNELFFKFEEIIFSIDIKVLACCSRPLREPRYQGYTDHKRFGSYLGRSRHGFVELEQGLNQEQPSGEPHSWPRQIQVCHSN